MRKVEIERIVDELQMRFNEVTAYYNTENGEILSVEDYDFRIVEDEEFEKRLNDFPEWQRKHLREVYKLVYENDRQYIALPNNLEIRDSEIMEDFIETIDNDKKRYQLENCMWQKGMYRKFKDKLFQIGLEEEYYKFYDEKLKEIVIEWCEDNNLKYE